MFVESCRPNENYVTLKYYLGTHFVLILYKVQPYQKRNFVNMFLYYLRVTVNALNVFQDYFKQRGLQPKI